MIIHDLKNITVMNVVAKWMKVRLVQVDFFTVGMEKIILVVHPIQLKIHIMIVNQSYQRKDSFCWIRRMNKLNRTGNAHNMLKYKDNLEFEG